MRVRVSENQKNLEDVNNGNEKSYLWPPSAAMCRGVDSVILFLDDVTTDRSNFISCFITVMEPFLA